MTKFTKLDDRVTGLQVEVSNLKDRVAQLEREHCLHYRGNYSTYDNSVNGHRTVIHSAPLNVIVIQILAFLGLELKYQEPVAVEAAHNLKKIPKGGKKKK